MATIAGLPVHPAAELFPMMSGADFEELVADIKANGQMDPIVIDAAGNLIDGRNRARACERLGITPIRKIYTGADVLQYVISCNLHRRHLTDSQRAMIAARLATRDSGQRDPQGQVVHMNHLPPSRMQAAEMLATSTASVQKAKQVIRDGIGELSDLVAAGGAPVATAARVATTLPPEQQQEYVERVKAGADPVKAAPAPKGSARHPKPDGRPPKPPVYGVRRKHAQVLEAFAIQLSGGCAVLEGITELDSSVTAEEAARIRGDLLTSISQIKPILRLLQERTQ